MRYMADESPCTCTTLRRLTRMVTTAYDETMKPSGLRVTQFSVLRTLARLGPLSVTRLAAEAGLDRSTMGRNLDPLEREGFVRITVGEADHRERVATLTEAGEEAIVQATPFWDAAQREMARRISPSTINMLVRQLQ
ncbi:MarR family winged helix-turn-helix transcriptional regulator [Enterovirga rhinocerotis]|nr:MarR family winged helix-turn-helix transcriptional regulator [Enterovirga rhinocerotis]